MNDNVRIKITLGDRMNNMSFSPSQPLHMSGFGWRVFKIIEADYEQKYIVMKPGTWRDARDFWLGRWAANWQRVADRFNVSKNTRTHT